jgi:hypothetical protein
VNGWSSPIRVIAGLFGLDRLFLNHLAGKISFRRDLKLEHLPRRGGAGLSPFWHSPRLNPVWAGSRLDLIQYFGELTKASVVFLVIFLWLFTLASPPHER